jgi:hypothetical protein
MGVIRKRKSSAPRTNALSSLITHALCPSCLRVKNRVSRGNQTSGGTFARSVGAANSHYIYPHLQAIIYALLLGSMGEAGNDKDGKFAVYS